MSSIVALGDGHRLEGFSLAGVRVVPADAPASVLDRWDALGAEVGLVILTAGAADALGPRRWEHPDRLTVVVP